MALKELYDKSYLEYIGDTGLKGEDNYDNPEVFKKIKDYKSAYDKDQGLAAFKITLFQRMSLIIGDNTSVHRMIADYLRNFILYTNIDRNSTSTGTGKRGKPDTDSNDSNDSIIEIVENLIAVLDKEATLESILEALRRCLNHITDHTDSLAEAFITLARCVPSEKLKQDM